MEWTEETTLRFVELYQHYEVLWNQKHPNYYNKGKKYDAWKAFASEMKIDVEECKKKINSLLSSLRREKAKIKKSQGRGKGTDKIYQSSWFAFQSLQFLWNKNRPRDKLNTMQVDTAEEVPVPSATEEYDESTEDVSIPVLPSTSAKAPVKIKKYSSKDDRLNKALKILTSAAISKFAETSNDVFGKFIAKKMDKYTHHTRIAVEQAIMNVLFDADKGLYENNIPNSHFLSNYPTHQYFQPQPYPTEQKCTQPRISHFPPPAPSSTRASPIYRATPSPALSSQTNSSSLATTHEEQSEFSECVELL